MSRQSQTGAHNTAAANESCRRSGGELGEHHGGHGSTHSGPSKPNCVQPYAAPALDQLMLSDSIATLGGIKGGLRHAQLPTFTVWMAVGTRSEGQYASERARHAFFGPYLAK